MNETNSVVTVGQTVPDFEIEIFDPQKSDFGKISLAGLLKEKKWVALGFGLALSADGATAGS